MIDPVEAALEIARTGAIKHDDPGRTDTVNMSVPAESFVIPADIVSSLGEGNTAAGFKVLEKMFPPSVQPHLAQGGKVPVVVAGGEYVVGPEHIKKAGGGDLKKGHEVLRSFVAKQRAKTIKTLKKLPKPVKG